jgi:DNA-binding NarL/FixJ family response regulator
VYKTFIRAWVVRSGCVYSPGGIVMPESPDDSTIVIVDPLPLRTVGLMTVLDRLTEANRFRVASMTLDEAELFVESDSHCSMIIYNVGGASLDDHRHARRIKSLRARAGSTPLVILSDSNSRKEVVAAFTAGAQGYLYAGTNPQLALQALSFIFRGGSYFPPNGQRRHPRSGKVDSPTTEAVHPLGWRVPAVDKGECRVAPEANTIGENPAANGLTERQKAVLKQLARGESNKEIARRLNIHEGTVKVHVRQIMRRMGAANRTQVALAASSGNVAVPADGRGLKGK